MKTYKDAPMKKNTCLECGAEMEYGSRPNKKFCCDSCRIHHNNKVRLSQQKCKTRVTRYLERNYKVLLNLLDDSIERASLVELAALGFNPSYVTSYLKKGKYTECLCYDVAYRLSDTKIFNIRRISLTLRNTP